MKVLKEISSYIIGLLFIIIGFLTFSYIEYVNQRPALAGSVLYYVIAVGFIFMIIGILFMVYYVKSGTKKKSLK
jgi:hypothetical protein